MKKITCLIILVLFIPLETFTQKIPYEVENIPFLVTYGPDAPPERGDDDHIQEIYFIIPADLMGSFYIRIFDPETAGRYDDIHGKEDDCTVFSIFPANSVFYNDGHTPMQDTLVSKTFYSEKKYDGQWYPLGPLKPSTGFYADSLNAYIFKLFVNGTGGDDGNKYRFFISKEAKSNQPVTDRMFFYYFYNTLTFNLWNDPLNVSHIYPFISKDIISLRFDVFNQDEKRGVRLITVARTYAFPRISEPGKWASTELKIFSKEKNTSFDFQFLREKRARVPEKTITIKLLRWGDIPLVNNVDYLKSIYRLEYSFSK